MVASTHNLNQKKRTPAGKRKARFLAVFLSVLLAAALLSGCGSQQEEEQQAELTVHTETEDTFSTTVMIGVSDDTPDVTALLEALPDTYSVETYDGEKALREALTEGRVNMAVLTPGGAATQYKKEGGITMVSPVYLGGYRLVGIMSHLKIQDPYRPTSGKTTESSTETAEGDSASSSSTTAASSVTVPHDPVEAGEISADSILPSQLRSCKVNVWHDTDTLIDLAKAVGLMDGMSTAPTVIKRYEEETPQDYLTEYNHYALTNICTAYGGQEAFVNKDELLDVDAYWQAMTGEPLPSAVLVVSNELLNQAAQQERDAAGILSRDFEAAMAAVGEQSGDLMRIVFYGTSNRGAAIMRTYYEQVYSLIGAGSWIPDDAFYLK
jgi:hypothetical protein